MDVVIEMSRTLSPAEYGPEAILAEYSGNILRMDDERKVGRVRAYVADIERARQHGYDALEFLDVDGSTWPYNTLLSRRKAGSFTAGVNRALGIDEVYSQNLLIIDRVEILPRYRGHDYGLQAMHLMLGHLALGCRLAAIKPYPLQFEGNNPLGESHAWRQRLRLEKLSRNEAASTRRLQRHYGRLGFVPVKGTELMVLDLDEGYSRPWSDVPESSATAIGAV
ncbi:hypothetical protein GCM10007862_10370 [Dyella lipolytica]|uniref:N-acetyltransferase domain-containing protein n=1 Tax=Dyella lipolytica TaxID=1867835 RepID=A0ABW8IYY2_9GAMM|nr:hypothetical protein [Dyella lipolytica]GLQ45986.1 hypothetical protein GCM10007862_10370 [Dyella lipolytica]